MLLMIDKEGRGGVDVSAIDSAMYILRRGMNEHPAYILIMIPCGAGQCTYKVCTLQCSTLQVARRLREIEGGTGVHFCSDLTALEWLFL